MRSRFTLALVLPLLVASLARADALTEARPKAIDQVVASSRSESAVLRANALEAAQYLPERATPMIQLALDDKNEGVRFAACAVVGKAKLADLAPLTRRLLNDPSPSVRAAAMYALRANNEQVDISPIADMLASQNPTLRGNAAMILGLIGDRSAAPLLRERAKVPMPKTAVNTEQAVKVQFAEALLRLGDADSLVTLRALSVSLEPEKQGARVIAINALGDAHDEKWESAFQRMVQDPHDPRPPLEVQMAAAAALSKFGRPDGLDVVLSAAESPTDTQRVQAAVTLAYFATSEKAAAAMIKLLDDKSEPVRLAAASAIVHAAKASPAPRRAGIRTRRETLNHAPPP